MNEAKRVPAAAAIGAHHIEAALVGLREAEHRGGEGQGNLPNVGLEVVLEQQPRAAVGAQQRMRSVAKFLHVGNAI